MFLGELDDEMIKQWLNINGKPKVSGASSRLSTSRLNSPHASSKRFSYSSISNSNSRKVPIPPVSAETENEQQTIDFLKSGTICVLQLEKEAAVSAFQELCGPADSSRARQGAFSLRGRFGTDELQNAVYCSPNPAVAEWELKLFLEHFLKGEQQSVAMLLPKAQEYEEEVMEVILDLGLQVSDSVQVHLAENKARSLFGSGPQALELMAKLKTQPVLALKITGDHSLRQGCRLFPTAPASQYVKTAPFLLNRPEGKGQQSEKKHEEHPFARRLTKEIIQNVLWSSSVTQSKAQLNLIFNVAKSQTQLSFLCIKPHTRTNNKNIDIFKTVSSYGFLAADIKRAVHLTSSQADLFCDWQKDMTPDSFLNGPCDLLALRKWKAVSLLKHLCGPKSHNIRKTHPNSLRAIYSGDDLREEDAVFCCPDVSKTRQALSLFFPELELEGLVIPEKEKRRIAADELSTKSNKGKSNRNKSNRKKR